MAVTFIKSSLPISNADRGRLISESIKFQMERRRAIVQAYAAVRDAAIKTHENILTTSPLPSVWESLINKTKTVTDISALHREIDATFRQEIAELDRKTAEITV